MDMRIPPLKIKILLESNPLRFRIVVRRLGVPQVAVAGVAVTEAHLRDAFEKHVICCVTGSFQPETFYCGKRDSKHHHLLEAISETAKVLELRHKLLYTTPSGWSWCIESVFRYW